MTNLISSLDPVKSCPKIPVESAFSTKDPSIVVDIALGHAHNAIGWARKASLTSAIDWPAQAIEEANATLALIDAIEDRAAYPTVDEWYEAQRIIGEAQRLAALRRGVVQ